MGAIGVCSGVPPDTEPLITPRCKQPGSPIAAIPSLKLYMVCLHTTLLIFVMKEGARNICMVQVSKGMLKLKFLSLHEMLLV